MMNRRYLVAIPVLVAIALLCARYWPAGDDPGPRAPVPGMAVVEQAAQREAANRLAQMAPAPALASTAVGKFSAETIQSAEDKFRRMAAVRGLITKERERRSLAQDILATAEGRELVREILLDPAFARDAFGAFQAEARFYSITVLEEAARQGNLNLVIDTASELAGQLMAAAGGPDPGRSEDLIDMAVVIGRNAGTQGLVGSDSQVLARVGFERNMPPSVRSLYVNGFFQGVWKAEGIENALAVTKRLAAL